MMRRTILVMLAVVLLFTANVFASAEGLALNVEKFELAVGEKQTLEAVFSEGLRRETITWKSSNSSVAAVSKKGVVTGKKRGGATITASTKSGLTAVARVTVYAVPTSVKIEQKPMKLYVGAEQRLTAKISPAKVRDSSLTWKSSKKSVAAVDADGVVKARKKGSATITVTTANGKVATVGVTVKQPVTSISLDRTEVSLNGGKTQAIKVKVLPSNASDKKITWSSSDKTVATVTGNKIYARKKGKCILTARASGAEADITATIAVTVLSNPKKVIALTFDDGPNKNTLRVLNTLKKYNARATFFVIGSNAKSNLSTLKKMHEAGHEIGNHTWSHPNLMRLSHSSRLRELSRTDEVIKSVTGSRPRLVRAPYGTMTKDAAKRLNRSFVYWSIDPQDWRYRNASTVTKHVVGRAANKKIVLLHDIHASTASAVERIIPQLINKGYTFVTVSELMEITGGGAPGTTYRP